jgi:hypothetical protein
MSAVGRLIFVIAVGHAGIGGLLVAMFDVVGEFGWIPLGIFVVGLIVARSADAAADRHVIQEGSA